MTSAGGSAAPAPRSIVPGCVTHGTPGLGAAKHVRVDDQLVCSSSLERKAVVTHRRAPFTTFVATLAAGTLCLAQAAQPDPSRPGAGASPAAGDRGAAPAAGHRDAAGAHDAAAGKQVDQQIEQQLQKIQQQKDNLAGDRLFVLNAAVGNQFEMALAQMAQQKAQDQAVKQLAQRIMQDHQQAAQQLQQVAQK